MPFNEVQVSLHYRVICWVAGAGICKTLDTFHRILTFSDSRPPRGLAIVYAIMFTLTIVVSCPHYSLKTHGPLRI